MMNTQTLPRRPVVPAPIFAVLLFLFVNVMFFAAFLSSYFVIKRGRTDWIPATIHLPIQAAGFNSLVLVLSGLFMIAATRGIARGKNIDNTRSNLVRSLVLGMFFLAYQLVLAVQLIHSGLTIQSSVFGGYYFLMIGTHALNVFAGIAATGWLLRHPEKKVESGKSTLMALQFFWLFVVGIWPVLYAEIYLCS